jgi:hypothetical protein
MKTYDKGAGFEIMKTGNYNNQRFIPLNIRLKIWLGNPLSFIGLFFFLFGLPFSLVFVSFSNLFSASFSQDDPVINGFITEANPTNSYINDVRVYEYKYQFKLRNGNIYNGTGYSTGNSKSKGDEIRIFYKEEDPQKSKADDLRNSEFGTGIGLIVLIFPGIGLIFLFFSIRKALKQLFILKVGNIADGKFLYKEATNVKVNNQTVYALTFEFKAANDQIYQAVARTHHYHRLEDEEFEKLVYDPENPENAVLLDELPRGIKSFFLKL